MEATPWPVIQISAQDLRGLFLICFLCKLPFHPFCPFCKHLEESLLFDRMSLVRCGTFRDPGRSGLVFEIIPDRAAQGTDGKTHHPVRSGMLAISNKRSTADLMTDPDTELGHCFPMNPMIDAAATAQRKVTSCGWKSRSMDT